MVYSENSGVVKVNCYYCESQFAVSTEGYMQLIVHQIIRHGQDCNKEDVSYNGTKLKE